MRISHTSLAVTVRDAQLGRVRAGLSRHSEHFGVSVGMAEKRGELACWQLLLAVQCHQVLMANDV